MIRGQKLEVFIPALEVPHGGASLNARTKTILKKRRKSCVGKGIWKAAHNGVPFLEAFEKAEAARRVIASNKRMSSALLETDEWRPLRPVFPCWTGTMAAYEAPGKGFGEFVEYVDSQTGQRWVFTVPSRYLGERNSILVVEHPDYRLEADGRNIVVVADAVGILADFPVKDGWYPGDFQYDIPTGVQADSSNPNARYLYRVAGARVGPAVRDFYEWGDFGYAKRRFVSLCGSLSLGLGMAVETPEFPLSMFENIDAAVKLREQLKP